MKILGKSSLSSTLIILVYIAFGIGILMCLFVLGNFFIAMTHLGDLSRYPMTTTFELPVEGYDSSWNITFPETDRVSVGLYRLYGEFQYLKITPFLTMIVFSGYFILLFLYFIVIIQLRNVLRTLSDGNPFILENARRIAVIGFAVIVSAIINVLWKWGSIFYFLHIVEYKGVSFPMWTYLSREFHPVIMFVGCIILIIAEIIRIGALMKEEQELTI